MGNDANINANLNGLNKLIKCFNSSDYFVRVGIIGSSVGKTHDDKSGLTNAELGNIHEQPNNDGKKMPKRSFLEMPLKMKLNFKENAQEAKDVKKAAWKELFVKNKPQVFFSFLGAKALDIVIGAFETNGYGEWQSWSEAYEKRRISKVKGKKKREQFWLNHNILTDTGKLRNSISFKVMKKK